MLTDVRFGFGEHGHLVGKPALLAVFDTDAERPFDILAIPGMSPNVPVVLQVTQQTLTPAQGEKLVQLYRDLRHLGRRVHVCVRSQVQLRDQEMAHDSILRVIDGDDFRVPNDDRYLSVSVHVWPGSQVLNVLTELEAPSGRHLVLDGEDFGHAKVWLQNAPERASWTLTREYPFNDTMEAPEIEELFARSG